MPKVRELHPDQPLKVVALGGGTGLAALLRALKPEATRPQDPWRLTGIVTVSDNGGSSGRLRSELGGIPPGDLRNCLSALTEDTPILADLLAYRFKGEGPLAGHALGNLMLLAAADLTGNWAKGLRLLGESLVTAGRLVPSTAVPVNLLAESWEGDSYVGEVAVNAGRAPFPRIWLEPRDPEPLPEALLAVLQADLVLFAPGSLHTSTLPNLLIPELQAAIRHSSAPRIYVANLMTEVGESTGLDLEAHVAILQAFGGLALDAVLVNDLSPSPEALAAYAAQGLLPLQARSASLVGVPVVEAPLLDPEGAQVRHEPIRLNGAIRALVADLRELPASAGRGILR